MRRLLLAVLLGLGLVPAVASAAPASRIQLDRVVAVVDDDVILLSELTRTTERHPLLHEALSQLPGNAGTEVRKQKRRDVEAKVLDELIDLALLRGEAERFEIKVTDEDVDRAMLDVAKQYGLTVAELRAQVEQSDEYASWAEYRNELRDQILQFKVPHYLATWSVSEAQVREHYRKMTKDESAKVRVVRFTFTPASQESADRDKVFARAQAVARRLRNGDEPTAVAADLKIDTELEQTIGRGEIAPVLETAIFSSPEGRVVGPIASGQGYVVFKILEHVASAALSYEQAKDRIREQLESEAFLKAEADLRRQLRAKAHIDIRL